MSSDGVTAVAGVGTIRVFVRWHDQTVFAGEDVRCRITFKNVAAGPAPAAAAAVSSASASPSAQTLNRLHANADRPRQQQQQRHKSPSPSSSSGLAPPRPSRGHRSTHSLSSPPPPVSSARNRAGSLAGWSPSAGPAGEADQADQQRNGDSGHRRSISIVSIASSVSTADGHAQYGHANAVSSDSPKAPRQRGHARASSLQIVSRGPAPNGPRSASHPQRPFNSQPSPLFHASYPPPGGSEASSPAAYMPEGLGGPGGPAPRRPTPEAIAGFKFPMAHSSPLATDGPRPPQDESPRSPSSTIRDPGEAAEPDPGLGPPPKDLPVPIIHTNENQGGSRPGSASSPAARILPTTSIGGTPRSSTELYSVSNNSTETLASEYVTQPQPHRTSGRGPHVRQRSNLSGSLKHKARAPPEALMMGYAQVQGSFTLDGSLVNLGPFEQVKRKAVVGGHQGGGVIGVDAAAHKRDSLGGSPGGVGAGLLRGFMGWGGNLTSSIGELLGSGELSTIKEMRGIASSRAVPLLSTPQSILFVDLKLAPGESRSFEYSFRLPRGLPPTHKGKAMKISYSLVIGTQRPGGAKEHQLRSVDIPFRVLGSVNSHGEILGHDLMAPYVLLRDAARVQSLDRAAVSASKRGSSSSGDGASVNGGGGSSNSSYGGRKGARPSMPSSSSSGPHPPSSSRAGFLSYVAELLEQRPGQGVGSAGLLSPTATTPTSRRPSSYFDEGAATAKEAIDLAILRSNSVRHGGGSTAANRFEIARNGRRVGVVTLARPSYRLGETIAMTVDFSAAEVPCYAVHAALETAERVDSGLALRSEASVHRVTRRVYASSSEAALFARRIVFTPTIPVSATPEFVTSGVSLDWKIRLEFVVPSAPSVPSFAGVGSGSGVTSQHDGAAAANNRDDDFDTEEKQGGDDDSDAGSRQTERAELVPRSQPQTQPQQQPHPLLEEVSRDDRGGLVFVAAETLPCESFEVAVPLRVYGAVCNGLERLDRDETASGVAV